MQTSRAHEGPLWNLLLLGFSSLPGFQGTIFVCSLHNSILTWYLKNSVNWFMIPFKKNEEFSSANFREAQDPFAPLRFVPWVASNGADGKGGSALVAELMAAEVNPFRVPSFQVDGERKATMWNVSSWNPDVTYTIFLQSIFNIHLNIVTWCHFDDKAWKTSLDLKPHPKSTLSDISSPIILRNLRSLSWSGSGNTHHPQQI